MAASAGGCAGGAEGRSAVQALLKLLQGGRKAAPGKENQDGGDAAEGPAAKAGGRKRKGQSKALQRPLIAICNDLFVSALRPLRAAAKILHFSQPQVPCLYLTGGQGFGGVRKAKLLSVSMVGCCRQGPQLNHSAWLRACGVMRPGPCAAIHRLRCRTAITHCKQPLYSSLASHASCHVGSARSHEPACCLRMAAADAAQ